MLVDTDPTAYWMKVSDFNYPVIGGGNGNISQILGGASKMIGWEGCTSYGQKDKAGNLLVPVNDNRTIQFEAHVSCKIY